MLEGSRFPNGMTIAQLLGLFGELEKILGGDAKVLLDVTDERHVVLPVTNWQAEPGQVVLS